MKEYQPSGTEGIVSQKQSIFVKKELVRKIIHLATAFIPLLLSFARIFVLIGLSLVIVLYIIAESMRCNGKRVFLVSSITEMAARKRDTRFVLGPVTLAFGVLCTSLFFDEMSAAVGIYALAFGDGLASLIGTTYGRHTIPFGQGKTFEGSATCFIAIFLSTFCVTHDIQIACVVALAGTFIEVLPLKDFDNFFIPIALATISQFYFHI